MTRPLQAVAVRELVSVVRARSTLVLLAGVTLVTLGIVFASSAEPDYLPTAVDLLLPMEFVVPAVAIALGYRTIAADAHRGELDVLETYPISAGQYVLGVFLGRAIALCVLIVLPLTVVGVYVATTSPSQPTFLASHQGIDSPIIFVRFVVLTLLFGLTVLAMAIAASALASSHRSALVLGIVVLGIVVIGLDLLIIRGFAGDLVPGSQLTTVLSLSPTSAYRSLVFETVLSTAIETDLRQAAPLHSLLGLAIWSVASLSIAMVGVGRQ